MKNHRILALKSPKPKPSLQFRLKVDLPTFQPPKSFPKKQFCQDTVGWCLYAWHSLGQCPAPPRSCSQLAPRSRLLGSGRPTQKKIQYHPIPKWTKCLKSKLCSNFEPRGLFSRGSVFLFRFFFKVIQALFLEKLTLTLLRAAVADPLVIAMASNSAWSTRRTASFSAKDTKLSCVNLRWFCS